MPALYEDALVYETGTAMTDSGALTAYSGSKTGRSPLDKRVVKEEGSEKDIWWGPVNKAMSPEVSTSFSLICNTLLWTAHAQALRSPTPDTPNHGLHMTPGIHE